MLANAKTRWAPREIKAWSAFMAKRGPESDAETLALFAEYVGQCSKTREDVKTWFEAIELDDCTRSAPHHLAGFQTGGQVARCP
ncbi:MAG: DUF5069 domain-containing protein [Verrucomicrobia bacterium]|nr:DUF5069 domain-containing protein [Verrucomicrobiota bacterium]